MRGDSAVRQLRLLLFLDERRELEVASAATRLGCTKRTVYRDLGVLERAGIPLYQEREGARARWRLPDGYLRRITLSLNWSEMLALTAGGGLLAGLAGTLFHESALTALEKLRGALPTQLLQRMQAAAPRLTGSIGATRGYDSKRLLLNELLEAVERQETVEIGYRKLGSIESGPAEATRTGCGLSATTPAAPRWAFGSRANEGSAARLSSTARCRNTSRRLAHR